MAHLPKGFGYSSVQIGFLSIIYIGNNVIIVINVIFVRNPVLGWKELNVIKIMHT